MKFFYSIFLICFLSPGLHAHYTQSSLKSFNNKTNIGDTSTVNKLNNQAFRDRLINPEKTLKTANTALDLAIKLNYTTGIAESYRVIGIAKYYFNQIDEAIENYLTALKYFKEAGNIEGEAKVYNNIGNLYRDIDYEKSIENFNKSLQIAEKLNIRDLIAGLHLNIGTINQRKKNYAKAQSQYEESLRMFKDLNDIVGIVQSQQNLGLISLNLNKLDEAKAYLTEAKAKAKEHNLNNSIASINLTLSSVYILQGEYTKAENTIKEGLYYTRLVKDSRLEYSYNLTSFDLAKKQKDYQLALAYLQKAYKQDSITYKRNVSDKISLLEAQHRQLEKQRENELTIAQQKYTRILFWASSLVAALAFFVIFLLVKNVKKSALTNEELTRLNEEVSRQKDDLDRTNQNLEEIITDRTRDLQIKNQKLSEYSSHLSHQIRSPVATLKGLMLLENDDLIDQHEFVEQLAKCIDELDDRIININENLNNPDASGLINES